MTLHYTAPFALPWADDDTSVVDALLLTQDFAAKVNAALLAGPASPPAAQDLATLAGRVTATENRLTEIEGHAVARVSSTAAAAIALAAGGSYTAVLITNPGQFTLQAEAGQWVDLGVSYACDNQVGDLRVDFATINPGTQQPVNYISGAGPAGQGVLGMGAVGGRYETSGGSVPYQVQAADIFAGQVIFRLVAKAENGARAIFRTATGPLMIWGAVK